METSSILLWGSVALVVIIVLGLLFSKRNQSKKEKMEPPIESPEKEYSVYNETVKCYKCGAESTDEYNDKPVCDSCFDELDAEADEEYDDWADEPKTPLKKKDEEDDTDYYGGGGFDLTSLAIGIVVLGITISIGATILTTIGDSFESMSYNTTTSNMTSSSIEAFSAMGSWFPIIFIVGLTGIILSIVLKVFSGMRDYGI